MQTGRMFLAVFIVAAWVSGCDMPKDPRETTREVRGGVLRVGVTTQRPWAYVEDGEALGVEPRLVESLAAEQGATVEWVEGNLDSLMRDLEHFRLHAVIGGVTTSSPWSKRVAMSVWHTMAVEDQQTFHHVFAVPRGENGWLHIVDEFLYRHRDEAERLLGEERSE